MLANHETSALSTLKVLHLLANFPHMFTSLQCHLGTVMHVGDQAYTTEPRAEEQSRAEQESTQYLCVEAGLVFNIHLSS